MKIGVKTPGIHHLTLRSANLERARLFYVDVLGFSVLLEAPNLFIVAAGSTAVVVRGPDAKTPSADVFNPFRVGLDHIALGCTDETELQRVASALAKAGVDNTGVKLDETLGKRYVAFKDPDRIAWEFYMA
jgi:glyoxylase I family protein